jgi:hypothetical protein
MLQKVFLLKWKIFIRLRTIFVFSVQLIQLKTISWISTMCQAGNGLGAKMSSLGDDYGSSRRKNRQV